MAKDPAFLFYPGDWMGGTMLFTRHHKGAYMDVLMAQYNNGHMTEKQIKILLGKDDEHLWNDVLKAKFTQDDEGKFYNERLEKEIIKRRKFTESRKKNLQKTEIHKEGHMTSHMIDHMENENDNIIIDNNKGVIGEKEEGKKTVKIPFEKFWEAYDKKVDRKICEKKWNNLPSNDQIDILNYLPNYIRGTPDKQYRKDPATFLNRRSWENEVITKPVNNEKHNAKSRDHSKFNQGYDPYAEIVQAKMGDIRH